MKQKKGFNFIFLIIAIILGATLFKHFNFKTFTFKMPALDILFLLTFIATVYILIRDYRKTTA